MIVDPRDSRTVWAGIEVDGVYKSLDGGDSWLHMPDLGPDPFHGDIHGMALKAGPTTSIYCTSPFGICLLYTSPSPRDRTRSRMPSSA